MPDTLLRDSHPIEAIIGREPSWLIRSGISLLFIVFIFLIAVSWFIKYPDAIVAPITITAVNPPVEVVSKANGRIIDLFIQENELVTVGQPLALLESPVNYSQLTSLQTTLETLEDKLSVTQLDNQLMSQLAFEELGDLQPALNKLVLDIKAYDLLLNSQQLEIKTRQTRELEHRYRMLIEQLIKKKVTRQEKLLIEKQRFISNKSLVEKGALTNAEISVVKNKYLDQLLGLNDIAIELSLYQLKIKQLGQELTTFNLLREEEKQKLFTKLASSFFSLKSKVKDWQHTYLISAPVNGRVSLLNYWSKHQYIEKFSPLLTITSKEKSLIGRVKIAHFGAGKIMPNQIVNISLTSFPAIEFGQLIGRVTSMSSVPSNEGYIVNISLPETLVTTYGRTIEYTPNLIGTAKIITNDKRVLERFLEKILFIFQN
jgi:multidrug efflux pump subunit AcrA (membrane-fusion protein)